MSRMFTLGQAKELRLLVSVRKPVALPHCDQNLNRYFSTTNH